MRPARSLLIPPLEQVFHGTSRSDTASYLAASVLAKFAADDPDTLTKLLLEANDRQCPPHLAALSGYQARIAPQLTLLVKSSPPPTATREEKSDYAGRQANAAIALLRLSD